MQNQNWIKKILPELIAVIAFIIISAVFSAPALKGDRLAPHDTVSWIYQSKDAADYLKQHGEVAGWTNNTFSGMPTVMTYAPTGTNWFASISGFLLMQPDSYLVNPIGFLFICMLGAFILLKSFRTSTIIAGIGAVGYGLSSYIPILIGAGHLTKVIELAYLPAAIGGLIFLFRGQTIKGTILFALFLGMYLSGWHLQIIFYSIFAFVAIAIYFLVEAIKKGQLAGFLKAAAIALVIGVGAALSIYSGIKGTSAYAKNSIRGGGSELTINKKDKLEETNGGLSKEYAFSWSNGIGETFCAVVPNLYGGASGSAIGENSNYGETLSGLGVPAGQVEQMTASAPTYFGPQPFLSGPIYFGAIVFFLFILGLFVIKSKFKWTLFGIGIFFVILSWGKNFAGFNYWMFDNFPLFNKFRSPNMALALTAITTFAIAFWGLSETVKQAQKDDKTLIDKLKSAAYVSLGLVVLIIIGSQVLMDHNGAGDEQLKQSFGEQAGKLLSALKSDRAAMALKDGFRSLLFIAIAVGALWMMLKNKITSTVALVVIGLASTIDLWSVGKRYLNEDNYLDEYTIEQQYFTPSPAVAEIMKDKDPDFKVLDLASNTFNDSKTSYFVKTIGGYHPAKLQSYQDLIETQISKMNGAVINMLNTKYIITQGNQQGAAPVVIPNPNALGNAWFVSDIKFVKTADEEILSMDAPSISDPTPDTAKAAFNPAVQAIVRDKYQAEIAASNFGKDSTSKIVLTNYSLPEMVYEANNSKDGFAVFSEIYYPDGWTAYVDGKETKIFPVNHVLRGIKVPAGKHKIEFKFSNADLKNSAKVELAGSIVLSLIVILAFVFFFKNRKKEDEIAI